MDAFQKQHFRQSLHSIMHRGNSSRADEESCEMHVRMKSKFGDGFQTLLTNVKNMNSWLKKEKKEEVADEDFGDDDFGDFEEAPAEKPKKTTKAAKKPVKDDDFDDEDFDFE